MRDRTSLAAVFAELGCGERAHRWQCPAGCEPHRDGRLPAWHGTRDAWTWGCRKCRDAQDRGRGALDAVAANLHAVRSFDDLDTWQKAGVRAWFAARGWCDAAEDAPDAPASIPRQPTVQPSPSRPGRGFAPEAARAAWDAVAAARGAHVADLVGYFRDHPGRRLALAELAPVALPDLAYLSPHLPHVPSAVRRFAAALPLVFALRDAAGEVWTLEVRATAPGVQPKSKRLPLREQDRGRLAVFGSVPDAVAAARRGAPVWVVEGGPDWAACRLVLHARGCGGAVLGAHGESGLPKLADALAAAGVPAHTARVLLVPHLGDHEDAGERSMSRAADLLAPRANVWTVRVPTDAQGKGDLSDALAGTPDPVAVFAELERAAVLTHRAPVPIHESGPAVLENARDALALARPDRLVIIADPAGTGKTRALLAAGVELALSPDQPTALEHATRNVGRPDDLSSLAAEALAELERVAPGTPAEIGRGAAKHCAYPNAAPVFPAAGRRRVCGVRSPDGSGFDPCEGIAAGCLGAERSHPMPGRVLLTSHAAAMQRSPLVEPDDKADPDLPILPAVRHVQVFDESPALVDVDAVTARAWETLHDDRAAPSRAALAWRHTDPDCPRHHGERKVPCGCTHRPSHVFAAAALGGLFSTWAEAFAERARAQAVADGTGYALPLVGVELAARLAEHSPDAGRALLELAETPPPTPPLPRPSAVREGAYRTAINREAWAALLALAAAYRDATAGRDTPEARGVRLVLQPSGQWKLEVRRAWAPTAGAGIVLADATARHVWAELEAIAAAAGRTLHEQTTPIAGDPAARALWVHTGAFRASEVFTRDWQDERLYRLRDGLAARVRRVLGMALAEIAAVRREQGRANGPTVVAVLTHRPLAEALLGTGATSPDDAEHAAHRAEIAALADLVAELHGRGVRLEVGYFGRDDKGSNRFADCDVLVHLGDNRPAVDAVAADAHLLGLELEQVYPGRVAAAHEQGHARSRFIRRGGEGAPLHLHVGEGPLPDLGVPWAETILRCGPSPRFSRVDAVGYLAEHAAAHGWVCFHLLAPALAALGVRPDAARRLIEREAAGRGWRRWNVPQAAVGRPVVAWAATLADALRAAPHLAAQVPDARSAGIDRESPSMARAPLEGRGETTPDARVPFGLKAQVPHALIPNVAHLVGESPPDPATERAAILRPCAWSRAWLQVVERAAQGEPLSDAVATVLSRSSDGWAARVAELHGRGLNLPDARRYAFALELERAAA